MHNCIYFFSFNDIVVHTTEVKNKSIKGESQVMYSIDDSIKRCMIFLIFISAMEIWRCYRRAVSTLGLIALLFSS